MGNEAVATKAAKLFSFNGRYNIADENSATDLLNDASIFLSSAIEIFTGDLEAVERRFSEMGDDGLGQRLWGAYHLFNMAKGAVDAANTRLHMTDVEAERLADA
jgi:hypothetical protein